MLRLTRPRVAGLSGVALGVLLALHTPVSPNAAQADKDSKPAGNANGSGNGHGHGRGHGRHGSGH